jgi:hypothetical protein
MRENINQADEVCFERQASGPTGTGRDENEASKA